MIRLSTWFYNLTILVVVIAASVAVSTVVLRDDDGGGIGVNLGLDLQGGSYLLLEVDMDSVVQERMDNLGETIRTSMRNKRIGISNLSVSTDRLSFQLRDELQFVEARDILNGLIAPEMRVTISETTLSVAFDETGLSQLTTMTVGQAIEIVRARVDETGTKEPVIQRQGNNRILLQLPGVDDPEQVKSLLGKTAKLGFQLVDISASAESVKASGRVPPGSELLPSRDNPDEHYLLNKRVLISGEMLEDARPSFDGQTNEAVVSFTLDSTGAERFGRVTGQNIGRPFAIVLDNEVISAPVIRSQIFANGQISGGFSVEETNELSLLLRSGALPAPLLVVEERSVGPGLGSDSVKAGQVASIVGLAGVAIFMISSYGMVGCLAVIAVFINMLLLYGQLSILGATLTLPGIAGIVLTIGMAVDANIIIFERIKEELRAGIKLATAFKTGFNQATGTIIDANLTTLAAALFLYFLGSGPIKGFSVTISVGVISSMFSTIIVMRVLLAIWINTIKPDSILISKQDIGAN
ncbi:protein translocase subunit SecD [Alphaproteobacteria bacterium]|jgi:preprotein translocase subunit SecD|nr:protein translocase subunit SecD [Alphaproteobacteria bacterium]MDC1115998.1 protein translocase subunit SecD [Alphaproteobacteria bacterium]